MAATRTVQEAGILAQVRNHVANAALGHMARNAFAHAVIAFLLLGFLEPAGGLNLEGVTEQERKCTAQHAEFRFQNIEDVFQQLFHVAFVNNRNANLLDNRDFWTYGC